MDIQLKLFELIEYKPATMRGLEHIFRTWNPELLQRIYGRSDNPPTHSIKTYTYNREFWKRYAFNRDEGICQNCGVPATEVHHIKGLWEGGSDHPDNLISLCVYCHCELDPSRLQFLR